jgi:hypothetical protein
MNTFLDNLPCIPCSELVLLCTVDIYDGPISGLVRHGGGISWFAWRFDDERPSPRRYVLHALLADAIPAAEAWAERHDAWCDEFKVAANPHIYPVSPRQRATMRTPERIQEDLDALADLPATWAALPATAWFIEEGQTFAAIRTITVPGLTAQHLDDWRRRLAKALAAEDQVALDLLFADPLLPGDPLDIHWLTVAGRPVVRDWRGRPLPDEVVLTARHHVSNYDGWL